MKKVLVVSDIYYEIQWFVKKVPKVLEFAIASEIITTIGSKTLNSARVLKSLGQQVDIFGKVGRDGLKAVEGIKEYGISVDKIEMTHLYETGKIMVQTNSDGHSSITLYPAVNKEIYVEDIEKLASNLASYDYVYAATNLPLETLYRLVELCEESHVPILVDFPNQQKEVSLEKLASVEMVVPNRQEAELLLDVTI